MSTTASAAQNFFSPGGGVKAPSRGVEEEKTEDGNVASTKCEPEDPQLVAPLSLTFKEPEDPQSLFLEETLGLAEDCVALIMNSVEESQTACNDMVRQGASVDQVEPTQKRTEMQDLINKQQIAEG